MKQNHHVILRGEGTANCVLSFPAKGLFININSVGAEIWKLLADNPAVDAIVDKLSQDYEDVTRQQLEEDVRQFLGVLKHYDFVRGYDGPAIAQAKDATVKLPEGYSFYGGFSMLRCFVPGDVLKTEEADFETLDIGDIIAFVRVKEHAIVHRVIQKTTRGLVTMGDNLPHPDPGYVTENMHPRLVTERILPDGTRQHVTRGETGIRAFRRHRLQYWACYVLDLPFRAIRKIRQLMH